MANKFVGCCASRLSHSAWAPLPREAAGRSAFEMEPAARCRTAARLRRHTASSARVSARPPAPRAAAARTDAAETDRRLLELAAPALATLCVDPVLSAVDSAVVGRCAGEAALASLGLAAAPFTFATFLFSFLSGATAPLVGQACGRGDAREAGAVTAQALSLAGALGVVATAAALAAAEPGLEAVAGGAASPELLGPAAAYVRIRALGLPATLVTTAAGGAFRGLLDTRTPLRVALSANAVNLALDLVLVAGLGLGLEGAAAATAVAEWCGAFVSLAALAGAEDDGRLSGALRPVGPGAALAELAPLLRASGAVLLRSSLLQGCLLGASAAAARAGAAAGGDSAAVIAAHQVTLQSWLLLAFVADSLATAAQGLVSESTGAGDVEGARAVAARALGWGAALGLVLGGGVLAAGPIVPTLFTDSDAVAAAAAEPLRDVAAMQLVNSLVFVGDGVLLGSADFAFLPVGMAAATALYAPSLLAMGGTLPGVWTAVGLLQVGRFAGFFVRFQSGPLRPRPSEGVR